MTSVTEPLAGRPRSNGTSSRNELGLGLTTSPELQNIALPVTDAPASAVDSPTSNMMTDAPTATVSCQPNCNEHAMSAPQCEVINDAMTCESTKCESDKLLKCESIKYESADIEKDTLLHQSAGVTVRLFKCRWLMIFLFACYSMSNAYQWIHLNIIFDKVCLFLILAYFGRFFSWPNRLWLLDAMVVVVGRWNDLSVLLCDLYFCFSYPLMAFFYISKMSYI